MLKKVLNLLFCLTLFSLLASCSSEKVDTETKKEPDVKKFELVEPPFDTSLPGEEGIKNLIRAYNYSLRNAQLADPYFQLLRKYATDRETQRHFIEIGADTQKGIAMRSWQKELLFENISVSENSGFVDSSELWDFEYIDIKTKENVEPKRGIRYKLKYSLEREDGRWVVSKVEENEKTMLVETILVPLKKE